ncbi:MAG TPA: WD40 repeat domain-containing protein [Gemmataceae bacterium]|nr:WD40 repeat domain-containing protein [Gemmataceae bacterium]
MQILRNTVTRPVTGVAFGGRDRILVAGGSGGFDVRNLASETKTFISSHAVKYLFGCACDPAGRRMYVSDYLQGFRIVELASGACLPVPGANDTHTRSFDLAHDGKQLLMSRGGYRSNRVECWSIRPNGFETIAWTLRNGEPTEPDSWNLVAEKWTTNDVCLNPAGDTLATSESRSAVGGDGNPLIVIRQLVDGAVVAELGNTDTGYSTDLAFAADGQVVYAWDSRTLERWDIKKAKRTHRLLSPGRGSFTGLAIHPSVVITIAGDGHARYWQPEDLSPLGALKCGIGKLHSVAVSRDSKLIAAGGDKGQVALWTCDF